MKTRISGAKQVRVGAKNWTFSVKADVRRVKAGIPRENKGDRREKSDVPRESRCSA
ncbi:hypothetical protein [Bacillus marinisedimentorum]|uniref:hypothetical protein n=1 Tax=Bacillus marinisedimentorum TaxID=1821260 RepID=UPI0012FF95AA|nr:hypothetical protein [Bacillus marinisedimentorum]